MGRKVRLGYDRFACYSDRVDPEKRSGQQKIQSRPERLSDRDVPAEIRAVRQDEEKW